MYKRQLLSTAGLASLHFSKDVTIEDFTRLVRAFMLAGTKAQDVSKQIKEALNGGGKQSTIKINEVKFVAADPLTGDISVAAQIAAQTLGPEFKQWLNDPQKLLQLIAAAEGANAGGGGQGGATGVPFGSVPTAVSYTHLRAESTRTPFHSHRFRRIEWCRTDCRLSQRPKQRCV